MILSTQTDVAGFRFGDEKAIRFIAGAGFDAVDYSMFCMDKDDNVLNSSGYEKRALELKKIAEDCGVFFNQAHAPFPCVKIGNEKYNSVTFDRVKRSIEIAGILGAKNIIVHPTDYQVPSKENVKENLKYYKLLIPSAKEFKVKIAVENMFGRDNRRGYIIPNICSIEKEFCEMMDSLDSKYFTACLDIGHAGLVGTTAEEMITALGHKRLTCLHVHDNDYREDRHMPPYFYKLDWDAITKALADIDYSGDFTFEADRIFDRFPEELMPSAFKLLHDIGRHLISKIESER
jgi:L-ribulose-5-phosphate 3-epimerase